MLNVTRTMYKYRANAYDLVDTKEGMRIEVVGSAVFSAPSISKAIARKAISEAMGEKLKKGVTIKYERIGAVTYAMPADDFFKQAVVIEEKDYENPEQVSDNEDEE